MQNNVCNPAWHENLLITSQKERAMNGSNALGIGAILRNSTLHDEAPKGRKSWKVGSLQSPHRALFLIGFVHFYVCGLLSAACCTRFKEAWPCRYDSGTVKLDLLDSRSKKKACVSLQWRLCVTSRKAWKLQVQGLHTAYYIESSILYLENFQMRSRNWMAKTQLKTQVVTSMLKVVMGVPMR